jgi:hypothetical protein
MCVSQFKKENMMKSKSLPVILLLICLALGLAACRPVTREVASMAAPTEAAAAPGELTWDASVEEQLASAMSAAPLALSQNATIMGITPQGETQAPVLREGANGWVCTPDYPGSPGTSPECFEDAWQAFWSVATTDEKPEMQTIGLDIMLQGGTEASTTEIDVVEPPPGEDWIYTPPHAMIVTPWDLSPADFSTDPHSGLPYIMWEGTTLEHLMIPVNMSDFEEADAKIRNAMSAAPLAVAKDATIVDFPTEAGGEPIVLREGTNGWFCYPDWPVSATVNDPECNDAVFEAWFRALLAGEPQPPELTRPGFSYMLQGAADPSNMDPMAELPESPEDWIITPGHLMVIMPGGFANSTFTTDPDSGEPFIMWQGHPYEHLMIPVADLPASK